MRRCSVTLLLDGIRQRITRRKLLNALRGETEGSNDGGTHTHTRIDQHTTINQTPLKL